MKIRILVYFLLFGLSFVSLVRQLPNRRLSRSTVFFASFLAFLLSVFPVWSGDYHHIAAVYDQLAMGFSTNLEDVYVYVAQRIVRNYLQFRVLLWGTGFFLILFTFKRLHIKFETALLFYIAVSLLTYSYARVSIAMAIMFYGLAVVVTSPIRSKFLSCFGGVLLIGLSFYFHKSALFGIVVVLMSLLLFNLDRWKFVLFSVGYIFLISITSSYLTEFLSLDSEETMLNVDNARRYMEASTSVGGLGERIQNILIRSNFYLVVFIIIKTIFNKTFNSFPSDIKVFSTVTILIVASATIFAFDMGYNTYVIYYRFLNFAIIPMIIVLSYCLNNNVEKKLSLLSLCLGLTASSYTIMYSLYLA